MKLKRPKISKKKIAIFSVFVFIATIFWFLDALNREYTTKIEYPIEFFNFPEDVSITSNYPKYLSVTIKAHGFDIIGKKNISNPFQIDIKKLSVIDKTDRSKLIISLRKISDDLFPKIQNIEIVHIVPESIILTTSKISSKKVPIKLNINYTAKMLYMQSGDIQILPDSITISGPDKILSKLSEVETVPMGYKNLNDTLTEKIQLKKISNVNFSKKIVNIILPIEKYTENEIKIPVEIINCPDSLKLITFPNEVKLTYKIGLSRYKTIGEFNFKAVVDFLQATEKNKEKILVQLTKQPDYLQSVKISPEYLEYIIEKAE